MGIIGLVGEAEVKAEVKQAVQRAAPGIEAIARVGYFAKGAVYGLLGLLAARAAFEAGRSAREADPRGVLEQVGEQPLGQAALGLLALGLVAFALWHLVRAVLDPERHGRGLKAWAKRAGYAISAGVHLSLAWFALTYALQGYVLERGNTEEGWAAEFLRFAAGPWLLGGAGLAVLALAANQFYIAWKASFLRRLHFGQLPDPVCHLLTRLGQVGIAARGVVLLIIGVFVLQAAWTRDPERAGGIAEALTLLETSPLGPWVLGTVALGLIAYGVFMVAQGRYRIIPVDQT